MKTFGKHFLVCLLLTFLANTVTGQAPGGCPGHGGSNSSPSQQTGYNPMQMMASPYSAQQNYLQQQAYLQQQLAFLRQQSLYRQQLLEQNAKYLEQQRELAMVRAEQKRERASSAKAERAEKIAKAKAKRESSSLTTFVSKADGRLFENTLNLAQER